MKKILLTLVMMISMVSFSQIELVEAAQTQIDSRISYAYIEKIGDDEYGFYYKNMNSLGHEYVNFKFKNISNAYDTLYAIMEKGFKDVPRDAVKFKAGGDKYVWLRYSREDDHVIMNVMMKDQDQEQSDETSTKNMAVSKGFKLEDIKALFKK